MECPYEVLFVYAVLGWLDLGGEDAAEFGFGFGLTWDTCEELVEGGGVVPDIVAGERG